MDAQDIVRNCYEQQINNIKMEWWKMKIGEWKTMISLYIAQSIKEHELGM